MICTVMRCEICLRCMALGLAPFGTKDFNSCFLRVFFYGNELIPVKLLYDFYKIPAFQMGAFDLPIC